MTLRQFTEIPMRAAKLFAICAVLALGGCSGGEKTAPGQTGTLAVSDAWIRLSPVPNSPSAAYFTLHGGKVAEQLTGVTSPQVRRSEMHETMTGHHGMSTMAPLRQLAVPAGGTLTFAPGGNHVMLFGLDPAATAGREVRLDFAFASGRTLSAKARVRAMGDDEE
jgi:copper(I)-binding protein